MQESDPERQIKLFADMVEYYRTNYEMAIRQIRVLRAQVHDYQAQLGIAPKNRTKAPPAPSFVYPEPLYKGSKFANYSWEQDLEEVRIFIPVDKDVKKTDVTVRLLSQNELQIRIKGEDPGCSGKLSKPVENDMVYWMFAEDRDRIDNRGNQTVQINLEKAKKYENWNFCFAAEDPDPENPFLPPLDEIE